MRPTSEERAMSTEYTYERLSRLSDTYGDAFYILEPERFRANFLELCRCFRGVYPKFNIAYSYKTNYIPRLCRLVDQLGGCAEVVSDMELDIARRCGVAPERIIFNGPYKNPKAVEALLLSGGTVNIDSVYELENIRRTALEHPERRLNLGLRVNFAINDGVLSRFGLDASSEELRQALRFLGSLPNLHLAGLHCHFASRAIETWQPRVQGMLELADSLGLRPERIDIGGGLFGRMADSLKAQFQGHIPEYSEYAQAAAAPFARRYGDLPERQRPLLLIEPGSALVGDCMSLVTRVQSIKTVRGKPIATVLASMYNINMGKKDPPLEVLPGPEAGRLAYRDMDIAGFTCIESDYLCRGYNGPMAVGDILVFGNVGSYSIVFKPPFILPNFPILELTDGGASVVKRGETFEDLFETYTF